MQHTPRLPKDGINISQEHPLKEATILVLGLGAVLAAIFALLLWFVDIMVVLIPAEAEARVLERWGLDALDFDTDSDDAERVDALLARVARHWPDAPYRFRVGILPEDTPNAFALPGGLVLVTQGLLDTVETENELALVLGHELGHFYHRDHLRRLGRGLVLSAGISVIAPSATSSVNLGDVIAKLTAQGFGREDEHRADRFGLALVHAEYGHVADAWGFFETLEAERGGAADDLVAYLGTHPSDRRRLALLADLAVERGWSTEGEPVPFRDDD